MLRIFLRKKITYLSKQNKVPYIISHCDFYYVRLKFSENQIAHSDVSWLLLYSIKKNHQQKTLFTTVKPNKRCLK